MQQIQIIICGNDYGILAQMLAKMPTYAVFLIYSYYCAKTHITTDI